MIEYTSIITNGYIDISTIEGYMEKGWDFVVTLPARTVHPFALPTDKVTIFSKYIPYEKTDSEVPTANQ
jgi:hypothetical protein